MNDNKIYEMAFSRVYPHYLTKAHKKQRTKEEVDQIITWLTGYNTAQLETILKEETDFKTFFEQAPKLNAHRNLVTGVICGIRVEEMEPTLMKEIRILDKLIIELAKGKTMEKILR